VDSAGLKFEPLIEVNSVAVCAPALVKAGLRKKEDLSRQVLIHLTSQPRAWPAWLKQAGVAEITRAGTYGSTASRRCWRRQNTAWVSRSRWRL
jgi:hypothetical protein